MKLEEIDTPCQVAGFFWKALRDRDFKIAFELLSAENKGFILSALHSAGVIKVGDGTAYQQLRSEKVQNILKGMLDEYVESLPLEYAPTNKARYHDGIHATCKLIPEEKYEKVVFIKPTELEEEPLLLPMILELFSTEPLELRWRVDFFRICDK